ncbi:hypothetical protein [Herbidospora cretacea]|uniref:hypothetical protein n=1 Tax=Herbidospora cretacea TaxID=28444 RepID=UPI000B1FE9BA|nr:hypothetical protein [Herbidospora cretacea]
MTLKSGIRVLAMGALLALPLAAVSATPAMAATNVVASGGQLFVSAGFAGDDISINVEGGFLVVRNFNDAISAGSVTCTNVDPRTVRCASTGITKMLVRTNTGADTVRNNTALPTQAFLGPDGDLYYGGSARDLVSGEGGNDLMDGNGGDDVLMGDEGAFDQVFGGPGTDLCTAEKETACEGDA